MNIDGYIVVDKISANNKYKCDTKKQFIISRNYIFMVARAWNILAIISFAPLIFSIIRNDVTGIIFFIGLIFTFLIFSYLTKVREKRKNANDIETLNGAIISLGTVISIKSGVIAVVKFDNNAEKIEFVIHNGVSQVNDKVGIIKTNKKPIILLKCTLVAVEE
ncbi:MAG: hypothetical protein FWE36_06430 [Erysipelotrichales bacterium]|nr:hypothetical protein [Erysipelotrichales bacterium]